LIGNIRGVCEEKSLQVLVGSLPVLDDCLCNGLHVSVIFTLSIFINHVYKALRYFDNKEKKIFLVYYEIQMGSTAKSYMRKQIFSEI